MSNKLSDQELYTLVSGVCKGKKWQYLEYGHWITVEHPHKHSLYAKLSAGIKVQLEPEGDNEKK